MKKQSKIIDTLSIREKRDFEEIAREQGIVVPQELSNIVGAGESLWDNDQQVEEFVNGIYERRKQGLAAVVRSNGTDS